MPIARLHYFHNLLDISPIEWNWTSPLTCQQMAFAHPSTTTEFAGASYNEHKKVWFYIALYPVRWTAQSALHFPPLADLFIPTPFSASLRKHSSHAAIAQRLFTHISTTVYSQVLHIYTAESTEASWSERKCPNFETVTTGIRTRALFDCESGILPTELPRSTTITDLLCFILSPICNFFYSTTAEVI